MVLRAGLIGCGAVGIGGGTHRGRDFDSTHAGAYIQTRGIHWVAAADTREDRRNLCRRTWGLKRLYQSYDEMLSEERLDVVSVCLPEDLHTRAVAKCIDAGVRGIWCEKPFTLVHREACALVRQAKKNRVVLAVNFQRRWDEGHRQFRDELVQGKWGQIQQIHGLYYGGLERVGSHLIDLLIFFFGTVSKVVPLRVVGRLPVAVDMSLQWPHVHALVQAINRDPYPLFELDVFGTKGRVRITDFGHRWERWSLSRPGLNLADRKLKLLRPRRDSLGFSFREALKDLLNCMRTGGEPVSSGRTAAETVCLVDSVIRRVGGSR